jgi:hypothetical protein
VWTYPDGQYSPVVADADRLYLTGNARIYGLVEKRAAPAKQHLVSASRLRQIVQKSERGISARRYSSVAAANEASGVQVCNVVLRKRKGSSPEQFWHAVHAVQMACPR